MEHKIAYKSVFCDRMGTDDVVEWNDAAGRTKEEVVGVLRSVEKEIGLINE